MESFSTQVEAVVWGRVRVLPQDKFFGKCTEKNPFLKTGFHRINLREKAFRIASKAFEMNSVQGIFTCREELRLVPG